MLRHFLIVWLLYWAAVVVLPVHSLYPATAQAFLLQLSFVVIVGVSAASLLATFRVHEMPECGRSDIPGSSNLIWISISISIMGLIALLYDKTVIQGIDYSQGLAAAREEWRRLGEDRDGSISSPFSAVGYFLGSGYFVATVLAITQTRVLSARERLWTLLICFVLLLANSLLTGGRSSILLIAPIVVSAHTARRGIRAFARTKNRGQRRTLKLLALLAFSYTLLIFYQRARAGDLEVLEYALDFLPFLGIEADDWYLDSLDGGALDALSALIVLATSYVTHSFSTVAAILEAPAEDKTIVFQHLFDLLSKLGLTAKRESDWFLSGRFPSLPGALWRQFGLFGFLICSGLLGVVCAAAKVWTVHQPRRLMPLGAYTMAEATLMLSPAVFAADFMSFPFVLISFGTMAAISWMLSRQSRRTLYLTRSQTSRT